MATRTAKLRVELDGEKEYKQAISELNKGNQVLASEMRKLQAEYKGNEKSIEALNAKSDLLQRQLSQQKDKVSTLREALANAAKQYGEADKRTQEWQIKLNDAEAAQAKLEHQIDETNTEIKQQGEAVDKESGKMVSLGDAVDQVAGKLGVKLPEGARKALDGMSGLSAGSVAAMGAIAAAVAVVIKAVKELDALTLESAKKADDLLTQSMTSGISTDLLQQFQYAAPYIDVSADTMVGALKKIGLNAATAAEQVDKYNEAARKAAAQGKDYEGTLGAQAAAFERLGVSVRDGVTGELRDAYDVMQDALRALGEVQNQTERNALANDVFGKSYDELAPLIQNADEAQRLYNEALDNGYVLSEQQLEILGEVDDAHEKFTQTLEKQKDLIALQWAPTTKEGFETLAELTDKAGKVLIDSKLVENFGQLVRTTVDLFEAGSELFSAMPGWLNPIEKVSNAFKGLAVVMAAVADYVDVVSGLMHFDFNKVGTALGFNIGKGQMSRVQKTIRSGSEYVSYNAAGTDDWRGGLTWVGESGPEMVALPQGSRIYNAQESRAAASPTVVATDLSQIEQLLGEVLSALRDKRVIGRMA